jgi:OH-DDVA oxygenase
MAEIVLGIASSHGPMLSMTAEQWELRAESDRKMKNLIFRGREYDYEALQEIRKGERLEAQCSLRIMEERYRACQRALDVLADTFARAAPDVAVIFGNDQKEVFNEENMPAFLIFHGPYVEGHPPHMDEKTPAWHAASASGYRPERDTTYPVATNLAQYLIEYVMDRGFDVSCSTQLPAGWENDHQVPHAFGFIFRRIMRDRVIPTVPIFTNTFYPPNTPKVTRVYQFGRIVGEAIRNWKEDARVALFGSGGLTHFVVDEDFDRQVIRALQEGDEAIKSLPEENLRSGNSEIKNWVAVAGALTDTTLRMEVVDYVPCYRTPAGTGTGQGFVRWIL